MIQQKQPITVRSLCSYALLSWIFLFVPCLTGSRCFGYHAFNSSIISICSISRNFHHSHFFFIIFFFFCTQRLVFAFYFCHKAHALPCLNFSILLPRTFFSRANIAVHSLRFLSITIYLNTLSYFSACDAHLSPTSQLVRVIVTFASRSFHPVGFKFAEKLILLWETYGERLFTSST